MSILHPKSFRDRSKLHKYELFIQMPHMHIRRNDRIELQYFDSMQFSLQDTVLDKLFELITKFNSLNFQYYSIWHPQNLFML